MKFYEIVDKLNAEASLPIQEIQRLAKLPENLQNAEVTVVANPCDEGYNDVCIWFKDIKLQEYAIMRRSKGANPKEPVDLSTTEPAYVVSQVPASVKFD